jgi:hypothetical protein
MRRAHYRASKALERLARLKQLKRLVRSALWDETEEEK